MESKNGYFRLSSNKGGFSLAYFYKVVVLSIAVVMVGFIQAVLYNSIRETK